MAIDGTTGIANKSFETGVQDWDMSCGVCHVGGGQMEYDRDMNAYDPNKGDGENSYFSFDRNRIVPGFLSATNKMEVDCLMCHLNSSPTGANESGAGRAWYQTYGCSGTNPIGPVYDPTCAHVGPVPGWGLPGAGPFTPGTAYDPENRNIALKTQQFDYAASLGIGAKVTGWGDYIAGGVDPTYQYISGITGVPSTITGANIQGTPASQNCSACHARDDNAPAYPGMMTQVRMGYGNMVSTMGIGKALDVDQCTAAEVAAGNCPNPAKKNTVPWIEFGCKTGMGKRGQKIGDGKNSYWGMSMFNTMFGLGKNPGDLVVSETLTVTNPNMAGIGITSVTIKERIPDQDVHDKAGFQCATCHYAIGSSKLGGATTAYGETFTLNNADGSVTIPAEARAHGLNTASGETGEFGVNYPAETIYGIDHQFAQGDNLKDTYGKNNLDGTVSCEGCHITRTHPRVASGSINPPIPTHAGFPAVHLDKIACNTCHIPEIYITPFNLKSRDWTMGFIKRGNETNGAFKNIYDWNYDLVTGSGSPLPLLHQWATKYEKKQIVPISPAEMSIWVSLDNLGNAGFKASGNQGSLDGVTPDDTSASGFKTCTYGARIFANCSSDTECPGGYCVQGMTTYASPAKTRDVMAAAETLQATQSQTDPVLRRASGNINTGSIVPLFDGWPFPDGMGIDTKARIDAMIAHGNATHDGDGTLSGGLALLKIFHAPFDITHGIVPKDWALGGSKRGGCVSCHSSAQPRSFDANGSDIGPNANYSPNSTAFFEGMQHWMPQEMGVGNFDMLKNPLTFFADFDCTQIVNGLCMSDQMCMGMCMGMMHYPQANCQGFCGARTTSCSGMSGSGPMGPFYTDNDLFGQSGFVPANNFFLQQCIGFMQPNFDMAMGWPNGTAAAMGMMDGVNGLQAFTIRETLSGTSDGCNPMIGPKNVAIMNFGGWNYMSDPNAISNATNAVNMMGNQNSCMPAAFSGTCTGTTPPPGYTANCVGGFRNGAGCIPMDLGFGTDADCVGTLPADEATHVQTTPTMSLILSRDEARARFKTQLQQSDVIVPAGGYGLSPDNIRRVWWPILTEQNPGNPSHKWAWDEAGEASNCGAFQNEPCCTNGMGMPSPCGDPDSYGPKNIKTTIHANQLLGYKQEAYNALTTLNNGTLQDSAVCSTCHNHTHLGHMSPTNLITADNCATCHAAAGSHRNAGTDNTTCLSCHSTVQGSLQAVSLNWKHATTAGTPSTCVTCHTTPGASQTVQLMCGSCHGGSSTTTSNGAPYFATTSLTYYANGMHNKSVPVATAPTATFTLTPVSGTTVTVNATTTFDANATTKTVTINWGDGSIGPLASGTTTTSHTYITARIRSYPITVAASDGVHPVVKASARVSVPEKLSAQGTVPAGATRVALKVNGHTRKVVPGSSFNFTNIPYGSNVVIRAYKYGTCFNDITVSGITADLVSQTVTTTTCP